MSGSSPLLFYRVSFECRELDPGVRGELGDIEKAVLVGIRAAEVLLAMVTHLGDLAILGGV